MDDILDLGEEMLDELAEKAKESMSSIIHIDTGALSESVTIEPRGKLQRSVGIDADKLMGDSRNRNHSDYSGPYYYGHGSWVGHKFLEETIERL